MKICSRNHIWKTTATCPAVVRSRGLTGMFIRMRLCTNFDCCRHEDAAECLRIADLEASARCSSMSVAGSVSTTNRNTAQLRLRREFIRAQIHVYTYTDHVTTSIMAEMPALHRSIESHDQQHNLVNLYKPINRS